MFGHRISVDETQIRKSFVFERSGEVRTGPELTYRDQYASVFMTDKITEDCVSCICARFARVARKLHHSAHAKFMK